MVLTLTLAYALSKVLVVTWFFPTNLGLDQEGKRRLDVVCLPLECLLPAGFLVLFQHITYAQPSVSRMPDQGVRALGWACSRKQYVLASQGLLGVFLNSRYGYGVPKNTLWATSKIMDLSHLGRP